MHKAFIRNWIYDGRLSRPLIASSKFRIKIPQLNAALQVLPTRPHQILTPIRPYTLPHRSPPSRSSPAVAAVGLVPRTAGLVPGSVAVSSPPDSVAIRRSLVVPTISSTWRTSIVHGPSSAYIIPPVAAVSSPAVASPVVAAPPDCVATAPPDSVAIRHFASRPHHHFNMWCSEPCRWYTGFWPVALRTVPLVYRLLACGVDNRAAGIPASGVQRVNLLIISDDTKQHYSWIKDISKLLSLQTSKHGHVRHVCFRFFNTFNSKKSLASHHEYCKSTEAIKIELPEEGSKISFKNHNRSMRVPFVVYADFEFFTPQLSFALISYNALICALHQGCH